MTSLPSPVADSTTPHVKIPPGISFEHVKWYLLLPTDPVFVCESILHFPRGEDLETLKILKLRLEFLRRGGGCF